MVNKIGQGVGSRIAPEQSSWSSVWYLRFRDLPLKLYIRLSSLYPRVPSRPAAWVPDSVAARFPTSVFLLPLFPLELGPKRFQSVIRILSAFCELPRMSISYHDGWESLGFEVRHTQVGIVAVLSEWKHGQDPWTLETLVLICKMNVVILHEFIVRIK